MYQIAYTDYILQKGDIINIEISSVDPTIDQIFTSENVSNAGAQMAINGGDLNYLTGFLINENGDIELPLIGKIQVINKNIEEATKIISNEVGRYINDPYVVVRLGGIRFSALGELNVPGRYSILQSNATIFEAIATAGDLTELANRKKILLIRKTPDGYLTHNIDLTERSLLSSPYYFIQPNDQIYVEPLPVRQLGGGVGVTGFETFTTALSIISSALVLIISINNLNGQ